MIRVIAAILFAGLFLFGCTKKPDAEPDIAAYETVKNYRLTFLMSGTFELKDGEYRDYLEDGRDGWTVWIDRKFCLKTEYQGQVYYAAVTVVNGGGTMCDYGVMIFKNGETVATLGLGDRIKVKSLTARNGKIAVEYFVHRENEKLIDAPTKLTEREINLANASTNGTDYKRFNLKKPEVLYVTGQAPQEVNPIQLPPPPPPGDSVKYGSAGFNAAHDKTIQNFIPTLKKYLQTDDMEAIIALLDFPVYIYPHNDVVFAIYDINDFKNNYHRIFNDKYKTELFKVRDDDFSSNQRGLTPGNRLIWLRPGPGETVKIKMISY